jgi:hypothetical protein
MVKPVEAKNPGARVEQELLHLDSIGDPSLVLHTATGILELECEG